ncbi:hypothetical protein Xaut_4527 [Xanthobacter versatilis]|uniref:Uncharacterized protein n=1 Tax=Xanthobacter autotrophicus (strain ATCC BAA-1158 / Py2) TaxID=78245 RepID=A7IP02_XANP2|nr:hypothetical protein Xaut_4527 [Xanthobacter autotrophicus Py2]
MTKIPFDELPRWFARWAELNPSAALSLRRTLLTHPAGGCQVYLPAALNWKSMYVFPEADQFTFPDAGPPGAKSIKS